MVNQLSEKPPREIRVFVSHSHRDDSFTSRLVADLRAAGAEVWVDTKNFQHGNFLRRINDGLERSDFNRGIALYQYFCYHSWHDRELSRGRMFQ